MSSQASTDPAPAPHVEALKAFMPLDRRWLPIARMIAEKRIDWLSLDVFDTVIFRAVPEPVDVFTLLGHELAARNGLFPGDSPESFVILRMHAEQSARRKNSQTRKITEVSINAIYESMPQKRLRIAAAEAMALELALERRLCRPNTDAFALIALARQCGVKVAFVSDTHFTRAFLLDLLRKGMPDISPDLLLVSQEQGLAKSQGLLHFLLRKTGAATRRILHVGDNPQTDIASARSLGIRTAYLPKYTSSISEILAGEWGTGIVTRAAILSPQEGDFGLTWMRTRLAASAGPNRALAPFYQWGATVMGPILTLLADWAALRVRSLAAETGEPPVLHCLMRDGRLLKDIMALRAPDITAHETWINRRAALKAALSPDEPQEIEFFLGRATRPVQVAAACRKLGLSPPAHIPSDAILTDDIWKIFLAWLEGDARNPLLAEIGRVRANLLRHMATRGIGKTTKRLFLLELGYNGTVQRALQRLCDDTFGANAPETYGLYLGTSQACTVIPPSLAAEGWLMSGNLPTELFYIVFRAQAPLEQACLATAGSLIEHDEHGNAVCDSNPLPGWQLEQIEAVQAGILAFARHAPAYPADHPDLIRQMRRTLIRALALPTIEEAMRIGNWQDHDNFAGLAPQTLAENKTLPPLGNLSPQQMTQISIEQLPWLFGAARRHSRSLAQRLYAIYSGKIEADLFNHDSA